MIQFVFMSFVHRFKRIHIQIYIRVFLMASNETKFWIIKKYHELQKISFLNKVSLVSLKMTRFFCKRFNIIFGKAEYQEK